VKNLLVISSLFFSLTLNAADLYVNNSGQAGTYTTVSAAVAAAAANDRIFVSPYANYIENIVITQNLTKACNWNPQVVPRQCNTVVIPFTTNQPVVSQVAACKDIWIYTTNGALLTVNNGANLQIETCPVAITINPCP
jgi:hypothetical protein